MCHDLPPLHLWRRLLLCAFLPGHPDLRQPRRRAGHAADRPDPGALPRTTRGTSTCPRCPRRCPRCRPRPPHPRPPYGYPRAAAAAGRPAAAGARRRTSRSRPGAARLPGRSNSSSPSARRHGHGLRGDAPGRSRARARGLPRPTTTRTTASSTRAGTDPAATGGCPCRLAGWPHAERLRCSRSTSTRSNRSRGPAPGEAVVEPWGLAGDRRWMLIDAEGKVVTQRQQPTPGAGRRRAAAGRRRRGCPRPAGSR